MQIEEESTNRNELNVSINYIWIRSSRICWLGKAPKKRCNLGYRQGMRQLQEWRGTTRSCCSCAVARPPGWPPAGRWSWGDVDGGGGTNGEESGVSMRHAAAAAQRMQGSVSNRSTLRFKRIRSIDPVRIDSSKTGSIRITFMGCFHDHKSFRYVGTRNVDR
jgi:hypothetical protein